MAAKWPRKLELELCLVINLCLCRLMLTSCSWETMRQGRAGSPSPHPMASSPGRKVRRKWATAAVTSASCGTTACCTAGARASRYCSDNCTNVCKYQPQCSSCMHEDQQSFTMEVRSGINALGFRLLTACMRPSDPLATHTWGARQCCWTLLLNVVKACNPKVGNNQGAHWIATAQHSRAVFGAGVRPPLPQKCRRGANLNVLASLLTDIAS